MQTTIFFKSLRLRKGWSDVLEVSRLNFVGLW